MKTTSLLENDMTWPSPTPIDQRVMLSPGHRGGANPPCILSALSVPAFKYHLEAPARAAFLWRNAVLEKLTYHTACAGHAAVHLARLTSVPSGAVQPRCCSTAISELQASLSPRSAQQTGHHELATEGSVLSEQQDWQYHTFCW